MTAIGSTALAKPLSDEAQLLADAKAKGLYGTWCWDCRAPALAADYLTAITQAEAAGWRMIRGVHRCPDCAAADDRAQARHRQERPWEYKERLGPMTTIGATALAKAANNGLGALDSNEIRWALAELDAQYKGLPSGWGLSAFDAAIRCDAHGWVASYCGPNARPNELCDGRYPFHSAEAALCALAKVIRGWRKDAEAEIAAEAAQ